MPESEARRVKLNMYQQHGSIIAGCWALKHWPFLGSTLDWLTHQHTGLGGGRDAGSRGSRCERGGGGRGSTGR